MNIQLLHDWVGNRDEEGHGAGMLSFRSQIKLIPEDLSNVASEGKLGRRHPDSARKGRICNLDSTLLKKKNSSSIKSPVQKYIEN